MGETAAIPTPECRELWEACRRDFESDGPPCGIYVFDTGEEDWDALLRALRRAPWRLAFSLDGWPAPLPRYGREGFALWLETVPLLELGVGPVRVRCRFVCPQRIEFDFEPGDVASPEGLFALLRFMRWLGRVVGRTVALTPADAPERTILEYVTARRHVRFHPV